jgi:hypothetical protein
MGSKHGIKSIQIDLPKATLIDVPSQQDGAFSTGRWAEKNTWTRNFTITGFKVVSGNFPRLRHNRGSVIGDE